MFLSLLHESFESFEVLRKLGKPIVDRETDVTKLLNCLSLAKLALSNVEERNPDFINEALFGRIVSKSSHSTTETGTKEKSLGYVQSTIPKESKILNH